MNVIKLFKFNIIVQFNKQHIMVWELIYFFFYSQTNILLACNFPQIYHQSRTFELLSIGNRLLEDTTLAVRQYQKFHFLFDKYSKEVIITDQSHGIIPLFINHIYI